MGYTRYWERTEKPIDREFIDAVNSIISDCMKRGIKICDGYGEGNPIVTEEYISINGDRSRDLDHETCYFGNNENDIGFDFCKTARKPYDYAVRRILEEAEKLGMVTKVHSDGNNDEIISDDDFLNR